MATSSHNHPRAPLFGLVDVNNFYVSCERAFNPRLAYVPDAEETELQALEEVGWRCLTPSMDRADYKLESSSNASALMKRVSARRGDVSVWLGTTASAAGLREFVISAQGAGHYCRAMTEIG